MGDMVSAAIKSADVKKGSSRKSILKFILDNYNVGNASKTARLVNLCLKKNLEKGLIKKAKDSGKGAGAFKMVKVVVPKKAAKKKTAKKLKSMKKASVKNKSKKGAKSTAQKSVKKTAKKSMKKPAKKSALKKPNKKSSKPASKSVAKQ